jgi:chaperonin GroES
MAISSTKTNPTEFTNRSQATFDNVYEPGVETVYDDGSVDVNIDDDQTDGLAALLEELDVEGISEEIEEEFYDNLVNKYTEEELKEIGEEVICAFEADLESRKEWEEVLETGFNNLGLKPAVVNTPFRGACGAFHPLIIENAVKFQSKASNEILPAKGPVRTQSLGKYEEQKELVATKIAKHMNWQTTTQMTEYYPDSEKNLLFVPLIGSSFKKVYYNETLKRNCSELVTADQFVVPYGAPDIERAHRYTQVIYKSEDDYNRDCASGLYKKYEDLGSPGQVELTDLRKKMNEIIGILPASNEYDYAYTFLEQHVTRYMKTDRDKFKIAKPYIITVDKAKGKVVGIRRNWRQGDDTYTKEEYFVHYPFIPAFGFYGFGLIHLLGNYQLTLTAILRSLVDAGQLSNLKGGFKSKNMRMEKEKSRPMEMGEWIDVETGGMSIKDSLMAMDYGEPSAVLMSLLEYMESRGQKFADSTEQVVADSASYGPVGTTLALLDASTKFFSAFHKRLHFSQKKELKLLAKLNRDHLDEMFELNLPGETYEITQEDYANVLIDVLPVSDPNIPSKAYLLSITQNKIQMLQQVPQLANQVNQKELLRRAFIAMDEEDVDRLILPEEQAQPQDPISDLMAVINSKPIKAFPGQNHDAHMQVKQAWLSDPMNGGSKPMEVFVPVVQANIREHQLMKFQEQIQGMIQQTGVATDPKTLEMVQAQAAQQIAQANQNQQMQGSPEAMVAQAEWLKAKTEVRKQEHIEQRDATKLALEANNQRIEAVKEDNRHTETLDDQQRQIQTDSMKTDADMINKALDRVQKNAAEKFKANQQQRNKSNTQKE